MKIYSIYDSSAEYYLPPLFARTDAQAKRMFVGSLGDSFTFRQDFSLYSLGSFDDDTGQISVHDPALILAGNSIPASMAPQISSEPSPQNQDAKQ